MKLQFSLRCLFVAITLIAIGSGAMAYFVSHFADLPPATTLELVSGFCCCPLIGAGLFTLIGRPDIGAPLLDCW